MINIKPKVSMLLLSAMEMMEQYLYGLALEAAAKFHQDRIQEQMANCLVVGKPGGQYTVFEIQPALPHWLSTAENRDLLVAYLQQTLLPYMSEKGFVLLNDNLPAEVIERLKVLPLKNPLSHWRHSPIKDKLQSKPKGR